MRIIFHLGHSRAASTYLQYYIFPKHKEINYIGTRYYRDSSEIKINQKSLNHICQNFIEPDIIYEDLKKKIPELLDCFDEKKLNIISTESYLSYDNCVRNFKDIKFLEKILKEKYENVEIEFLIILRNQYTAIKSKYFHSFPIMSEVLGIDKFEKFVDLFDKKNVNVNYKTYRFFLFSQIYDFLKTHKKLNFLFKNSKIHYLFYEDFRDSKNKFISELIEILNLDQSYTENLFSSDVMLNTSSANNEKILYWSKWRYEISKNYYFIKIKKYIPRFLKDFLLKISSSKTIISQEQNMLFKKKVTVFYEESNKKFFDLIKKKNIYS